jgi:hypothetical protein
MTNIRKPVSELTAGDMIDLEGIDREPDNEQIWLDEYAVVESVSTVGNESSGWADLVLVARPESAVIYTENGAVPAVVPADATFEILGNDSEPFTGADAMEQS